MEPRLTRSAKRKQEASVSTAQASTEGAGPSSKAGPCLRNTRSRKTTEEASAKATKAPAPTRSKRASQPAVLPAKRAADKSISRARNKRQATGKAVEAPDLKQEEHLPNAPSLPEQAQQEAGPSQQEAGPSAAAGPSTRMEDSTKAAEEKPSDAVAAAQREADDQVCFIACQQGACCNGCRPHVLLTLQAQFPVACRRS